MTRRSGLSGVSKLRRKLRRMPVEVRNTVIVAIRKSAEEVEAEARRRIPKDTGDLAEALQTKFGRDKLSASVGYSRKWKRPWRKAGWRAHFVEFGTRAKPARPFLQPAIESKKKVIIDRIGKAVDRALLKLSKLTNP